MTVLRLLLLGAGVVASTPPASTAQSGAPLPAVAFAEDRSEFTFSYHGNISFPNAVWVVGSTPELGAWDVTKSVKLSQMGSSTWELPTSMPAGRAFEYKFISRSILAGTGGDPTNATDLTGVLWGQSSGLRVSPRRVIWARLEIPDPLVRWINADGAVGSASFRRVAVGGSDGDWFYLAPAAGIPEQGGSFWIESGDGSVRIPSDGAFTTTLVELFLQGGEIFAYEPAPVVSAPQRRVIQVTTTDPDLGYTFDRRLVIYLPRGYDEHTERRYPVLYFHDGQVAFSDNPNRAWHAQIANAEGAAAGLMREAILVGVFHGSDRGADYLDPSIMGRGDLYLHWLSEHVKPLIDASYRTLTGPRDTGSVGASFGGVAAIYHGWERPDVFGLIGSFSPSFWATSIDNTLEEGDAKGVRVYLDSGDSGTSNDGYENTSVARDRILRRAAEPNVFGEHVYHVVGHGDQHHEVYWAERLPNAMRFLLPAHEQTGGFPKICEADFVEPWGVINLNDLLVYLGEFTTRSGNAQLVEPFVDAPDLNDLLAYINRYAGGCTD